MISLLQTLVDLMLCWLETAGVYVVNAVVVALAAVVGVVVALMPNMPTLPSVPTAVLDGFAYGNYFFPVSYLVDTVALVGTLWLAWIVVRIPLRWAKANPA